jgi:hypoxanthine phosphoribosyltransferase
MCTLLAKPGHRRLDLESRYIGFELPDVFVVGYGLDFDERYRQLPYIAEFLPDGG